MLGAHEDSQGDPEQLLPTWLAHPAFQARQAWLRPLLHALAAVGGDGSLKSLEGALQQPFRPLPMTALLPRVKVGAQALLCV